MLLVDCYKPNDVSAFSILIAVVICSIIVGVIDLSIYSLHCNYVSFHNAEDWNVQKIFLLELLNEWPPAGFCGGAAGESSRHAEIQHSPEERWADAMRSHQLPSHHHKTILSLQTQRRNADMQTQPLYNSVCQTELIDRSPANVSCRLITPTVLLCLSTVSAYITCRECGSVSLA